MIIPISLWTPPLLIPMGTSILLLLMGLMGWLLFLKLLGLSTIVMIIWYQWEAILHDLSQSDSTTIDCKGELLYSTQLRREPSVSVHVIHIYIYIYHIYIYHIYIYIYHIYIYICHQPGLSPSRSSCSAALRSSVPELLGCSWPLPGPGEIWRKTIGKP